MHTGKYFIIAAAVAFVFLSGGCTKKGCMDKNAINYNVAADEDDGSCEYCASSKIERGSVSDYLIDFNSSSLYYNNAVALFYVRQEVETYNFQQCGLEKCKLLLRIQNLTNKEISFNYTLNCNGNLQFSVFPSRFVSIQPYGTTAEDTVPANINFPCGSITNSFLDANYNGMINYN